MDASIDTDIVIHLYSSGKEELTFHFFDQLYMHAYLYESEEQIPQEQGKLLAHPG